MGIVVNRLILTYWVRLGLLSSGTRNYIKNQYDAHHTCVNIDVQGTLTGVGGLNS